MLYLVGGWVCLVWRGVWLGGVGARFAWACCLASSCGLGLMWYDYFGLVVMCALCGDCLDWIAGSFVVGLLVYLSALSWCCV